MEKKNIAVQKNVIKKKKTGQKKNQKNRVPNKTVVWKNHGVEKVKKGFVNSDPF